MFKCIFILLLTLLLISCGERYRYPCQDIDNRLKKECSLDHCKHNRDCPDFYKVEEGFKDGK